MAVRGFTIQNELGPLKVELTIPSFLGGRAQLTEAEVKESQKIVSVRISVERPITRINRFKALNHIPLTLHGSVNQIWTVSCILCNFLPPLTLFRMDIFGTAHGWWGVGGGAKGPPSPKSVTHILQ